MDPKILRFLPYWIHAKVIFCLILAYLANLEAKSHESAFKKPVCYKCVLVFNFSRFVLLNCVQKRKKLLHFKLLTLAHTQLHCCAFLLCKSSTFLLECIVANRTVICSIDGIIITATKKLSQCRLSWQIWSAKYQRFEL